jgi:hypothetical protein
VEEKAMFFPSTQNPAQVRYSTYARRSDGSYVRRFEVRAPNGEIGRTVELVDLKAKSVTLLEPFTKLATTFPKSDSELTEELALQDNCEAIDRARANDGQNSVKDNLFGVDVERIVETSEGMTVERWVARDLDCYSFQKSTTFSSGAHNEEAVVKFEQMEPDDSYFEIPGDYVQASPLQVEEMYSVKFPGHAFWGKEHASKIEQRFQKKRR